MSTKRQKCGRRQKNLALDSFSPLKRGHPGKWCRKCRADYRLSRKGVKKAGKATRKVNNKKARPVLKKAP